MMYYNVLWNIFKYIVLVRPKPSYTEHLLLHHYKTTIWQKAAKTQRWIRNVEIIDHKQNIMADCHAIVSDPEPRNIQTQWAQPECEDRKRTDCSDSRTATNTVCVLLHCTQHIHISNNYISYRNLLFSSVLRKVSSSCVCMAPVINSRAVLTYLCFFPFCFYDTLFHTNEACS